MSATSGREPPLVLLVDDDVALLDTMEQALGGLGVRMARATDGQQALEQIETLNPAVVVLDLILPIKSGARVLAELRSKGSDVQVILISGVVGTPAIGPTLDFLPKPCDADELRASVARAIARAAKRDA